MNEKILVVDDEPISLALTEIILRRKGFVVQTACSAFHAQALLAKEKPDLVILDMMMPGISGFEFCRELRARQDTAKLPVLMLSVWFDIETVQRALAAGADEFLQKTSPPTHIIRRVNALLANGKQDNTKICQDRT